MVLLRSLCITAVAYLQLFAAPVMVSIKGKVTDGTAGIQGAAVYLVRASAFSSFLKDSCAADGVFQLEGQFDPPSAVAPFTISVGRSQQFGIRGNSIHFKILSPSQNGNISLFTVNGRRSLSVPLGTFEAGTHRVDIPPLATGFYYMHISIDGFTTVCKLVAAGSEILLGEKNTGRGAAHGLLKIAAGAMMAWAWGASRILDALEMTPEAKIDPYRCAIIGCSRDGKGAMVCGVFDERMALTLPMEGGSGGISSWRIAKAENPNKSAHPDGCQTAEQIIGENVWMSPDFNQFAKGDAINKLPTDAHTCRHLRSPRHLHGGRQSEQLELQCMLLDSRIGGTYGIRGARI
ncbi:MAG: T9SS type A sorting domain-containing protein [Chitinispirillaceae bacterium]|nr:T9SS type A sorting domain-containing protein [Chitinispirillaceae bacterium]